MNLVIDVGNSYIKIAIYQGDSCVLNNVVEPDRLLTSLAEIKAVYPIDKAIWSSVGSFSKHDFDKIALLVPNLIELNYEIDVPFTNNYLSPETLGVDRIALAAAAASIYPNQNVLIIDAGSCITYDFVNSNKEYIGGSIAPGISMRYKALHHFTAKLPLLEPSEEFELQGKSTEGSIHSGVILGVLGEINAIIESYKLQNKKLTVVLTGGDTNFLAKRLKNGIFAHPNFLLDGLNVILNYNSKND